MYSRLSPADRQELEGYIRIFLAEKQFEGCGGQEITAEVRVLIAAQACLLLLHRDTDCYPGFIASWSILQVTSPKHGTGKKTG